MTLASISLTLHLGLNAFVSLFYPVFKINFIKLFVQGPIPEMQMLNIASKLRIYISFSRVLVCLKLIFRKYTYQ